MCLRGAPENTRPFFMRGIRLEIFMFGCVTKRVYYLSNGYIEKSAYFIQLRKRTADAVLFFMVEHMRIELTTSRLRTWRSPS